MPPSTKNGHSQPKRDTSQPESGEKMATAKYCAEANSEEARPRSALGNHMMTARALAGKLGASIRPSAKRSANIKVSAMVMPLENSPTKPINKVETDHNASVTP